jgi:hypothetical protein
MNTVPLEELSPGFPLLIEHSGTDIDVMQPLIGIDELFDQAVCPLRLLPMLPTPLRRLD